LSQHGTELQFFETETKAFFSSERKINSENNYLNFPRPRQGANASDRSRPRYRNFQAAWPDSGLILR